MLEDQRWQPVPGATGAEIYPFLRKPDVTCSNAYIIRTPGDVLIIDTGADAGQMDRILSLVEDLLREAPRPVTLFFTHCHADHWLGLEQVVAATGATTYAAEPEVTEIPIATDVALHDGDKIRLGDTTLEVAWLTGHRASYLEHVSTSAALIYRDPDGSAHVFAGDCLFPGGIGNTCDDPAAFTELLNDVAQKLFAARPDKTTVYPGHGADTTLGAERPSLAEWANRSW